MSFFGFPSSLTSEFSHWLLACTSFTQLIKPWVILQWPLQYFVFSFGLPCSFSPWSYTVPEQIQKSFWSSGGKGKIKKKRSTDMRGHLLDDFTPPSGSSTRSRLDLYQTYVAFLYAIALALHEAYLRSHGIYPHFCKPIYCTLSSHLLPVHSDDDF